MNETTQKKPRISLATQVLIGLAAGIAAGIFFGELVAGLKIIGDAFIQLLQMTVIPYILVSLIIGLGRLTFEEAKELALKGGVILLLLWAVVLLTVMLMPLAFPNWESASFFSTALVEEKKSIDFLQLYIPANPFYSLSNTIVPAIVLFSVAFGLALIGINNKHTLIDNLAIVADALMRITQFVAMLAPIGVFAIAASAAGTMSVEEFGRLQVYLIAYAVVALILSFWVLPGLVTSLTPIRYGDIIGRTRDALTTAFATGNILIVLPILAEESKTLLAKTPLGQSDPEATASSVDVLVPASFNFPNLGKLLSLSFVPFAAWFMGSSIPAGDVPNFLVSGLASFFGEVVVAMPFLLNLLQIPSDMFQLFITVDAVTGRFGTLLAAMHTVTLTLLGACAMGGVLTIRWPQLLRFAVVSVVLMVVSLGVVKLFFTYGVENTYRKDLVLENMQTLGEPRRATVFTEPPPPLPPLNGSSRLDRIRERGVLRVGYVRDHLPFSYFNASGELVGFDIEMAHALARDLDVYLEFTPFERGQLEQVNDADYCDILLAGTAVTPDRTREVLFATPHLTESGALVVKDHRRAEFNGSAALGRLDEPRIGIVGRVPYYEAKLKEYVPQAKIVRFKSMEAFFEDAGQNEGEEKADALLVTAEVGSAWSLINPQYSVVILQPLVAVPVAYPMAEGDRELADYINAWLGLKQKDQTIARLFDYWIQGKDADGGQPRWSIIRDVLGWVD